MQRSSPLRPRGQHRAAALAEPYSAKAFALALAAKDHRIAVLEVPSELAVGTVTKTSKASASPNFFIAPPREE